MIIPFFIPHSGCPHQCVFCNQKNITGRTYGNTTTGGSTYDNGGGSGGGILINVSTLSGIGTISAKGVPSSYGGAGGGGRIAVYYDTTTLPTANVIASGGLSGTGGVSSRNGGAGMVYLHLR